jgi:hypothetical protein
MRKVLLLLTVVFPLVAHADADDRLSAEWWEWALSIPTASNPLLDPGGASCMIGQHGDVWFLAGTFFGGSATRSCSIPEGKDIYFPIVNSVNVNTPNVCGQVGELTVPALRQLVAVFIDQTSNVSAQLDGAALSPRRIRSRPFSVALPADNLFVAPCGGDAPAGVYSPAVDDGIYVLVQGLAPGAHELHFHADANGSVAQDITYHLTIVPVSPKNAD